MTTPPSITFEPDESNVNAVKTFLTKHNVDWWSSVWHNVLKYYDVKLDRIRTLHPGETLHRASQSYDGTRYFGLSIVSESNPESVTA